MISETIIEMICNVILTKITDERVYNVFNELHLHLNPNHYRLLQQNPEYIGTIKKVVSAKLNISEDQLKHPAIIDKKIINYILFISINDCKKKNKYRELNELIKTYIALNNLHETQDESDAELIANYPETFIEAPKRSEEEITQLIDEH